MSEVTEEDRFLKRSQMTTHIFTGGFPPDEKWVEKLVDLQEELDEIDEQLKGGEENERARSDLEPGQRDLCGGESENVEGEVRLD